MDIKERVGRIITFGMFDKITGAKCYPNNIDKYVAAGNPGVVAQAYPPPVEIPETFTMGGEICHKEDYLCRTVSGNSMLVDGIHSGWELLLRQTKVEGIEQGDFIVIDVDKEYYKHRHNKKEPLFQLKLRRAIGTLNAETTVDALCRDLAGTFAEPLDKNDYEDLKSSLLDAHTFYVNNTPLFLSVTYHNSDIHYSFHPTNSIKYMVVGVAYNSDKGVEYKLAKEL